MFKVQKKKCDQCLFTANKIVDDKRKREILIETKQSDSFFICHKATLENDKVCCRGFWDKHKHDFNLGRIAQRLNCVQMVDVKGNKNERSI